MGDEHRHKKSAALKQRDREWREMQETPWPERHDVIETYYRRWAHLRKRRHVRARIVWGFGRHKKPVWPEK